MIMGDFNIDVLIVKDHPGTSSCFNNVIAHNLLSTITRITNHFSTLSDNNFTNAWPEIVVANIITSEISDHLPIFTCFILMLKEVDITKPIKVD